MSNTIILDGYRLEEMLKRESIYSEDNIHKGEYLRNILLKDNIIFSRVTPDQKLIIVDAAQKLNHIVAVTGDGINDAPAMKKADIGIAMNLAGTDVTKEIADILILYDNLSNIYNGILRGRIVFDIMKRMISYNLCSNVSEVLPVILSFILKFPLPMNAIQILTVDVLSDVYTNITYAYERSEGDVMERLPRNTKVDNLSNIRLFTSNYLFTGMIECTMGFLGFFLVLNDFGITPKGSLGLVHEKGFVHSKHDIYNPNDPYKGNSILFMHENHNELGISGDNLKQLEEEYRLLDFFTEEDTWIDMRIMFPHLKSESWTECAYDFKAMHYDTAVCYSIEAVRHAQTAYFVNLMFGQIINGVICRTISVSLFEYVFDNMDCNLSYLITQGILCLFVYVPKLNNAWGCRPLIIQHWCPNLPVWIIMFSFSETMKYLIRNVKENDGSPGYFYRWFKY